ncbi:solute carrier family 22 member 13-like isoform X1 [Parambassis ranga]|uniref:Solute carrier family 22 member 13-like isoform X1 n=1 Tax=Parambassis ranga TaxID=210632 RepID=A0A6P7K9E6_9TELE|nr:solute carrier family 22 member 13-like isoform X1 [Parambassis ranga]
MMDFGEILRAIGDFGCFQKLIIFGLSLPHVILALSYSSFLFIQSDPERHCNTDWILRADPDLSTGEQLNLTLPREEDGSFSRCRMFVPVDWNISDIREHGLNETTGCRDGWVYTNSLYEATIVTDFDLVCEKANMAGVSQMVFMMGLLTGSFIFGPAANSYGRRRTTQLPVILLLIFPIAAGVSPNFSVYIVFQFIIGAAVGGYKMNSTLLATEWIGITRRSSASCLCQMFLAVGQCAIAGLVYVVPDWRKTQYIMGGAEACVFLYIWWIPESARWLLGQGRIKEANELIQKVAAINKKKIPDNLLGEVPEEQTVQSEGIRSILTSGVLMKYLLIMSFVWFSLSLGYFCLMLNVGGFGLNIFLVQFFFGFSELLASLVCLWVLELSGRKKCLMATLMTAGFLCLLTLAFPRDSAVVITILVIMGKFFFSWASSVCTIYIQELFPTSVRQSAVGLGYTAYRVGGLMSSVLNMLAVYHWSVPTTVFSSLAVVSGALVFLLPETSKKELPDSTSEAKGNRTISDGETEGNLAENNRKSTKL